MSDIGRPGFVQSEAELEEIRFTLKLQRCPHCGHTGALIGHGFLRGYSDSSDERIVRGRRFFCSNRHRRTGCGRTFSVALSRFLPRFIVTALALFEFVRSVVAGSTRYRAWRQLSVTLSLRSGYRLWQRLGLAQAHLRARLSSLRDPPASSSQQPVAQLMAHFEAAGLVSPSPFAAFQSHFGLPLLP